MKKLSVKLKHCYGIEKLDYEFDFEDGNTILVYAPNGVMKTSLAKTFADISNGRESEDLIYPSNQTTRRVTNDAGSDLEQEQVFVVNPYDEKYKSDKIATLLVNETLKKQYESVHDDVASKKQELLSVVKDLSGLSETQIEQEVCNVFYQGVSGKFDEALQNVQQRVRNEKLSYPEIVYSKIFTEDTEKLLGDADFRNSIVEYIKKYDELLNTSTFFKKGIFNHTQASTIATQLERNGFFKAEHTISLKGQTGQVTNKEELEQVIEQEKDRILTDANLKMAFERIDGVLKKNNRVKDFREYLSNNETIVAELKNPDSFKAKLLIFYFQQHLPTFDAFLAKVDASQETIDHIRKQAEAEESIWGAVIDAFNQRFFVPFELVIQNRVDVKLGRDDLPKVGFKFENIEIGEDTLMRALSQGEKKALYILNALFEITARKQRESSATLLVVDDIADSFDYKNKYAIIEYLNSIHKDGNFRQIILTHNFDFFRSVQRRIIGFKGIKQCLIATKTNAKIALESIEKKGLLNPFDNWKRKAKKEACPNRERYLIALIPLMRNLSEYKEGQKSDTWNLLSRFLHAEQSDANLKFACLDHLYQEYGINLAKDADKGFSDALNQTVDALIGDTQETLGLESKVVLSIAIRVKAENFLRSQLGCDYKNRRTQQNIDKYREKFPDETRILKSLDSVSLMTPEAIHLNSFMYEPILDLSDHRLKSLYREVSGLLDNSHKKAEDN